MRNGLGPVLSNSSIVLLHLQFSSFVANCIICYFSQYSDKQCSADPMPTWLLKDCVDDLAPFLCYMFNASLQQGIVPSTFKSAFITPLLKKPCMLCHLLLIVSALGHTYTFSLSLFSTLILSLSCLPAFEFTQDRRDCSHCYTVLVSPLHAPWRVMDDALCLKTDHYD